MVRPMDHSVCNIIWDGQLGPEVPEWGCLDKCYRLGMNASAQHPVFFVNIQEGCQGRPIQKAQSFGSS